MHSSAQPLSAVLEFVRSEDFGDFERVCSQ